MSRIDLVGVDGSNPLGFLAALGLLRVVPGAKLGFCEDGSFRAFVDRLEGSKSDLATLIAADAEAAANASAPWRFTYTKAATKKQGPQEVADLKPPPDDFKKFLATCIEAWLMGDDEAAAYAAAYGTDIAVDGKGNTKPTAFHFTAAQQTFLGAVERIRASVTQEWVETSLFEGHGERPGSNLRWDPGAERNWALMANNPGGFIPSSMSPLSRRACAQKFGTASGSKKDRLKSKTSTSSVPTKFAGQPVNSWQTTVSLSPLFPLWVVCWNALKQQS